MMIIFHLGILYANLEAFSLVFQEIRHWGPVVGSLPFIALLVGIFFAAAVNIYNNKYYFEKFKANGNKTVPEARLPPMMIGGIAFTAGLFVFGCKLQKQEPIFTCTKADRHYQGLRSRTSTTGLPSSVSR